MSKAKSWEEYKAECEIIALSKGYKILGHKEWKGCETKLLIECPVHGVWDTCKISNFKSGKSCPSCGELTKREKRTKSREAQEKECEEEALKRGWRFLGIYGEWLKAKKTRVILRCDRGHEFNTSTIDNFKNNKQGCPVCRLEDIGKHNKLSDDQHIQDFMSTGVFPEGTTFTNTGEKAGRSEILWSVFCPICAIDEFSKAGVGTGYFIGRGSSLKQGMRPCRCSASYKYSEEEMTFRAKSDVERRGYVWLGWIGKASILGDFEYGCKDHGKHVCSANNWLNKGRGCPGCAGMNQQQAYINYIYDEQDIICALKFGIANNSNRRIKEQNSRNVFTMKQSQVWHFPTVKQCKDAEKRCKRVLHTEAVSKYSMPDGYTETVELSCMASIQNIYKLYGGTLQEETC